MGECAFFRGVRRRWRVVLLRAKGEILGRVEAPDAQAAKAVAVVQFNLDEVRRRGCRTCSLAQRLGVSRGCPKTNDPFEVPGSRFMACLAA